MTAAERRLCDVCLQSFAERDLVRAGSRMLCEECAHLQGVDSQAVPRVIVRRPTLAEAVADREREKQRAFGEELIRCLDQEDLQAFEQLFLSEAELRPIVGRGAAPSQRRLIEQRLGRDFRSKRSLYARQPGEMAFVDFEYEEAEEIASDVTELRRVTIRFRVGEVERRMLLQRVYCVRGRYRLYFLE
ncbi:MAG: hypothetical protein KatS3mg102_2754 [Planctomycetota bacterium]|nr:MAG: hypothetical protein KatS3mg102_2754 [Planctomycetota bacterium]